MATAEALPILQRTPEWIEARNTLGVGASQCAAALGISQWQSRYGLWTEKLRLVPPREPSIAMQIGTATEALNASRFEAETGLRTRRANRLLRSKAHPFLLTSLDRDVVGEDAIAELKWTERGDGYGEPGTDEVPDEVLCQVIQQMAVTGRRRAYVSVLFGGRRHAIYVVDRDADAEQAVIEGVAEFWDYVQRRTQPPVDGSDATLRALAERFPRDSGEEVLADDAAAAAMRELLDTRDAIARLGGEEQRLRAVIEDAMGEASALVAPGVGRVTWKAPKPTRSTDWRAIAQLWRPSDRLIAEHTTTKPSSRRFLPKRDREEETHG